MMNYNDFVILPIENNIIDIHHTNSTVHTIMTKDLNGEIQIITIDYKENEDLVKNNERF